MDRAAVALAGGYIGGGGEDEITALARDPEGNLIVAGWTDSPDFKATPGAVSHENGDAFVQKIKADGSAVIWTAVIGGSKAEEIQGLAVDSAGNIYVAGWTASADLPTTAEAFQRYAQGGVDGFVAKLNASGSKLEYCTFLGGAKDDTLRAISVDANGSAALTGWTGSSNFPAPSNSVRSAFSSGPGVVIARLDPAGKTLKAGTVLSGNGSLEGTKIQILPDGSLVVAGTTQASDLPMVKAWQKTHRGAGAWKSGNGGLDWMPNADGMRGVQVEDLALDAKNPQVMFAATRRGVFKSTDGGASWKESSAGLSSPEIIKLGIDPSDSQRIFAATWSGSVFRTVDGGASWSSVGTGLGQYPTWVGVDPKDNKNAYVAMENGGVFKSTDGGETWRAINMGLLTPWIYALAIHPENPSTLFAAGYGGVFRSDNGGQNWTRLTGLPSNDMFICFEISAKDPKVMFASALLNILYKSTDGGATWQLARQGIPLSAYVWDVKFDVARAETMYAATDVGMYRSLNGGTSWELTGEDLFGVSVFAIRPDPSNTGVIHAGGGLLGDAFLLHLASDGNTILKSTYLGGARDEVIHAMAVDSAGDIYLAGGSESDDFAVTGKATQVRNAGAYDAFVARLDGKTGALAFSTLIGGRQSDTVQAMSVDDSGVATVAALTLSTDIPQTGGSAETPAGGLGDVYVAKISTRTPSYMLSTVVGGTRMDFPTALLAGSNEVWIGGWTLSRDLAGGMSGLGKDNAGGSSDGFLVRLSGMAASMSLDTQSLDFEIVLDGSPALQEKRLKAASPAGVLPAQLKVTQGAEWLQTKEADGEIVVTADARALAPGEYKGSFEVSAPQVGVAAITVTAKLKVKANTPPVVLGVVHGSEMISGPVAPGLVVRIQGEGFVSGSRQTADVSGGVLPVSLGGVQVLVNGTPAPLEWVEEKEISAIVPYAIAGSEIARIVVERGGAASEGMEVSVSPTAPGLFTQDGSGAGAALAKNEDGTRNSPDNPAERGRPVVMWATGEGLTDPAGSDGLLALEALPRPLAEVEVLVSGIRCDVYYAGAAPAKPAGYLELNFKIPEDAPAGTDVPVVLRIGGKESTRTVTLALK